MRQMGQLGVLFLTLGLVFHLQAEEIDSWKKAAFADANRFARAEERCVLQALTRRITLDVDEISLDQAIEQLSQLIDLDILINERALIDDAVSKESTVTLNLGEITAWQALHFLLKPLNLVWMLNDGVLEITTASDAEGRCVTRFHDVKKLCQLLTPITNEKFLRSRRAKSGFPGIGGMGAGMTAMAGRAMFSVPTDAIVMATDTPMGVRVSNAELGQSPPISKTAELLLAHLICDFSCVNWEERDGMGGTVSLGDGVLIVTQSFQGQLEIAGMLHALELLADGNVLGNSISAQKPGSPVEENAKIFSLLAKPKSLQVDEGPLAGVLKKIAQDAGFRLWIDHRSLLEVDKDCELLACSSRRFRELPLGICLKKILEHHELTFVVEEGVVVITSIANADQSISVRFFDMGESSKITGGEQREGLQTILRGACRAMIDEGWDDEIAFASFISTRQFVVRQTQQANERIATFVDDLVNRKLPFPIDPTYLELEFRTYTAPDIAAATDLVEVIPQLLEADWNPSGSIRRAGSSLIVNQPATAHDRIEEIMTKLGNSHALRNPPAAAHVEEQLDQPALPQSVDDRVN